MVSSTGCGFVLPFLVVALGAWVLSEHGGPGGSVPAALFSGPPSSGRSFGEGPAPFDPSTKLRGARLRVNGNEGPFDGAQDRPFGELRTGPFDPSTKLRGARLRVNGNEGPFDGAQDRPFGELRTGPFDPSTKLRGARLRVNGSRRLSTNGRGGLSRSGSRGLSRNGSGVFVGNGFGGLVADDVYDELLGGGDPVVGLEAVVPVLHYVVEELDDGAAVGRLGADEPGHEVFIYRREHSEEVLRKGVRGVQGGRRRGIFRAGARDRPGRGVHGWSGRRRRRGTWR